MPLTIEQRAALWTPDGVPFRGNRIVSARPGTGKTTALTDYCIAIASDWHMRYAPWQGMAVVSYTNVAKNEFEQKFRRLGQANSLLGRPHFIGTVDAFVNQFLFLPFGANFMNFSGRPKLVGEPYSQWSTPAHMHGGKPTTASSPIFFESYGVDLSGSPFMLDATRRMVGNNFAPPQKVTTENSSKILSMKEYVWSSGYALQNDATYIAFKTLVSSIELTRAFIGRFPVLIVDEAQDMTEVQHAILDHLLQAGHEHIVLIGDEYQAIYEWNTARPLLFVAKVEDRATWKSTKISGTFRCSAAVCSALANMAKEDLDVSPALKGKNGSYKTPVEVRSFQADGDLEEVCSAIDDMAHALSTTDAHDDNPENIKTLAILSRSSLDLPRLEGTFRGGSAEQVAQISWGNKYAKDFMRVIFLLQRNDIFGAVEAYENLLFNMGSYKSMSEMRVALAREWSDTGEDRPLDYNMTVIEDLRRIATPVLKYSGDIRMSTCMSFCDVELRGISPSIRRDIARECDSFAGNSKPRQDRPLAFLFASKDARTEVAHREHKSVRLVFSTVHGVKGETYDGVIFYTKESTSICGCDTPRKKWAEILQHSLLDCENKRIAYVALSRAAQMLFIVAPNVSKDAWNALLTAPSPLVQSEPLTDPTSEPTRLLRGDWASDTSR